MTPYAERLKDPRWQKKRLEVLSRANWSCEECGAKDRTLHVHHRLYRKGLNPWDYEDHELQSLCADCHETVEQWRLRLNAAIANLSIWELRTVVGFADGLLARSAGEAIQEYDVRGFDHATGFLAAVVGYNSENESATDLAQRITAAGRVYLEDIDWWGETEVLSKEPEATDQGSERASD